MDSSQFQIRIFKMNLKFQTQLSDSVSDLIIITNQSVISYSDFNFLIGFKSISDSDFLFLSGHESISDPYFKHLLSRCAANRDGYNS